jgi:hypothetical protein
MPYRNLPDSDERRVKALGLAERAYDVYVTRQPEESKRIKAISDASFAELVPLKSDFVKEVQERGYSLTGQTQATVEKDATLKAMQMTNSHFFIVMNLAIARGKYLPTIRPIYGLDTGQESVPDMIREADASGWAQKIIAGETHRISLGGVPMQNPELADVQAALTAYFTKRDIQLVKKSDYDSEQEDVENMRAEVDALIKDLWDQVEFYFRKDEPASLRRKARAWGVEYATRPGEEPEPEPKVLTGTVLPLKFTVIMEGGFDVNTMFIVKNTGTVNLEFYTAAEPANPLPGTTVKVASGKLSEIWAMELGAETNTLLMAYNASADTSGSYEVTVGNPE